MKSYIKYCSITIRDGDDFSFNPESYRINGYAVLPVEMLCNTLGVECNGFVDAIESGKNDNLVSDVHKRLHDSLQDNIANRSTAPQAAAIPTAWKNMLIELCDTLRQVFPEFDDTDTAHREIMELLREADELLSAAPKPEGE
jgi:hypothetical protein